MYLLKSRASTRSLLIEGRERFGVGFLVGPLGRFIGIPCRRKKARQSRPFKTCKICGRPALMLCKTGSYGSVGTRMKKLSLASLSVSGFLLLGQVAFGQWSTDPSLNPSSGVRLRVMHYNVANLFDTLHDDGKRDWEFTPRHQPGKAENCNQQPEHRKQKCLKSDWIPSRFDLKLNQIKTVVTKSPRLPDLLAIVEIENPTTAQRLADVLGYKNFQMTESPDQRGIDVALLFNETSNLKFVRQQTRRVDLTKVGSKPSRDILAVEFSLRTEKQQRNLVVFVNHWPSQSNPSTARWEFARALADWAQTYSSKGFDVVITGDFNVDERTEVPSPLTALQPNSKEQSLLNEVDPIVRSQGQKQRKDLSYLPAGTYFFVNRKNLEASTWNLLDRFFVSGSLLPHLDWESYRIVNSPDLTTTVHLNGKKMNKVISGTPKFYDHLADTPDRAGFSDHFAIWMDLVF